PLLAGIGPHRGNTGRRPFLRLSAGTMLRGCSGTMSPLAEQIAKPVLDPGRRHPLVLRSYLSSVVIEAHGHGQGVAAEMADRRFPGETRLVRDHGRNTSRGHPLARPCEPNT